METPNSVVWTTQSADSPLTHTCPKKPIRNHAPPPSSLSMLLCRANMDDHVDVESPSSAALCKKKKKHTHTEWLSPNKTTITRWIFIPRKLANWPNASSLRPVVAIGIHWDVESICSGSIVYIHGGYRCYLLVCQVLSFACTQTWHSPFSRTAHGSDLIASAGRLWSGTWVLTTLLRSFYFIFVYFC